MGPADDTDELNARIIKGTVWVAALRLFVRSLGFVSTIILARILVPDDFGLVALAAVIAGSIELLGAFNFDIWLVRHQKPLREDYDTVWTLALIRDLSIALLIVVLAGPASVFFSDPRLQNVLYLLAGTTAVGALSNIGIVDFRREMAFDREFRYLALKRLVVFVVTIGVALVYRNYWAMLAGMLAGTVARVVLSYLMHPYRPGLSLALAAPVFQFCKWLLLLSFSGLLYRKVQNLIIGKYLGSSALGIFSMSHSLADLATADLLMPLRRVLVPAYSRMRSDMAALRTSFAATFSLILLLGVPIIAGMALLAEPLVQAFLGAKWLQVAPVMQIMAVYAMFTVFLANQGPVLMALGHTRLLSNLYGFGLLIKVPLMLWVTPLGSLEQVAMTVAGVHVALFFASVFYTLRTLDMPLRLFLLRSWHALAAGFCMCAAVLLFQQLVLPADVGPWLALLAGVGIGAPVYILTVLALWYLDRENGGGQSMVIDFVTARWGAARR